MPAEKITSYLESQNIAYKIIEHQSTAYTAQEIAAATHIPGKQLAKTVMVKVDGKMAMAVISASQRVNFSALKEALGAQEVSLATEREFKNLFPDCEVGAMPPFGHLYDLDVYLDRDLAEEIVIAFCAGSHTELVQISQKDFTRLVKPKVIQFAWQA